MLKRAFELKCRVASHMKFIIRRRLTLVEDNNGKKKLTKSQKAG
jgi:hypothetical protein